MIEISLFNLLGVSVIGVLIAFWYSPLQAPKQWILSYLPSFFSQVFNCSKCSSFVLGLVLFHNVFAAALAALLGFIIAFVINYIENWYE